MRQSCLLRFLWIVVGSGAWSEGEVGVYSTSSAYAVTIIIYQFSLAVCPVQRIHHPIYVCLIAFRSNWVYTLPPTPAAQGRIPVEMRCPVEVAARELRAGRRWGRGVQAEAAGRMLSLPMILGSCTPLRNCELALAAPTAVRRSGAPNRTPAGRRKRIGKGRARGFLSSLEISKR